MKKFILGNYFDLNFEDKFDGVITDIPYKNCIKNKLNEQNFDLEKFMIKTDNETKNNSFLITFVNFLNAIDLINISKKTNWKFHTYQIWNKNPCRTWISWNIPLRTTEFIIYFKKNNFKFSFKNGLIKDKVNRSNFGGILKNTNKNQNENSFGMFQDIISIPKLKSKIHPTEKPIDFSEMFSKIVGINSYVLDCCCGSGNLLKNFENSVGVDILKY